MLPTVSVELEGHPTFHEALRCYYLHSPWCNLWSNWNVLASLVVIAALVLGLPKLILPAAMAARLLLPGGLALLVLAGLLGVFPYFVVRQRYKDPDLSDTTHYTFDTIGYEVAQPGWKYRVDWTNVREIRESKSIFFFYLLPTQSTIIPKRIFRDGQTLAAWRSLIATSAPSVPIRRNSIVGRFL
jgi:hypothetical protein